MNDLRADLRNLTNLAVDVIHPLLTNPLLGGWSTQDELRFDQHGQPRQISRARPDLRVLIPAATRQLLGTHQMDAMVQRVTASGLLTERFIYSRSEAIDTSWQVNAGLLQAFLLRYGELASDFSWQAQAFDQTWEQFEAYTTSGEAALEVTSLLHHARLAEDSIPVGDLVTIHALRERDKERIWTRIRREGSTYLEQPYGWDAALKTRITWRRGQQSALQQGRDLHEMALAAVRLLRPGRPALSVSFADPVSPGAAFASPGAGLSDLIGWRNPVWSDPLELSGEDRNELERLLSAYRARKDDPELAFALRRFFLSYERQLAEDRLVDGWIALESLFGNPQNKENVSDRLADSISDRLRDEPKARKKLRTKVLSYYNVRSAVVHGNRYVSPEQITKVAQRTDILTREALVDRITSVETPNPQGTATRGDQRQQLRNQ